MKSAQIALLLVSGGVLAGGIAMYAAVRNKPEPVPPPIKEVKPIVANPENGEGGPSILEPKRNLTQPIARKTMPYDPNYATTIRQTANMTSDGEAQRLAQGHGLNILNLTWEDTGRYKDSAVGPNISDMTIQVGQRAPGSEQFQVTAMPVIRYPNFSDKTCDIDPRDFTLLIGNQKGETIKRISLHELLENPTAYLSNPNSWKADKKTLLAPRDSKVLVSAQACFLPVPKQGIATFNPVVFNYQSVSEDPAVLTILATREGTSVTIIDNKRDAFPNGSMWGQRLFHNINGMRASLTGQRISDYLAGKQGGGGSPNQERPKAKANLNMVLLIQVPLKQKERPRRDVMYSAEAVPAAPMAGGADMKMRSQRSDVEAAVIGHGDEEGPFTEIDDLKIERDERFPIRVTVQFYKATSNGVVSPQDLSEIKQQIDQVYAKSDYVGSLVTQGATGRVTEYDGSKVQPTDWWEEFWRRHERNTGDNREVAIAKLRQLLGDNYIAQPVCELYLRTLLKRGKV